MPQYTLALSAVLLLSSCSWYVKETAENPDPNHTHADFALWVNGQKLDFSGNHYMSGSDKDEQGDVHAHEHKHLFLHLHDGNGHVIHRHKPGLTLNEFLESNLGMRLRSIPSVTSNEQILTNPEDFGAGSGTEILMRIFVSGKKISPQYQPTDGVKSVPAAYVFNDLDHILITDAADDAEIQRELSQMTDDACLYSRTCPERGEPPVENCIADPTVPCVVQ